MADQSSDKLTKPAAYDIGINRLPVPLRKDSVGSSQYTAKHLTEVTTDNHLREAVIAAEGSFHHSCARAVYSSTSISLPFWKLNTRRSFL